MKNLARRNRGKQSTIIQHWLAFRPMETASYVTLVIGYIVSVLSSDHLTLFNFTATTLFHLLSGLVFIRLSMAQNSNERQLTALLVVVSVLTIANGLLATCGLWFNFLF